MRQAWIIFLKEVIDNFRDRRSLSISLLTAIGLPILMVGLLVFIKRDSEQKLDKVIEVPTEGLQYAAQLASYLHDHDIILRELPKSQDAEGVAKEHGLAMSIDADIKDGLRLGKVPQIRIYYDGSRTEQRLSAKRVQRVMNGFSETILSVRLGNLGVRQDQLNVLVINDVDVSNQGEMLISMLLGMLPMIMIVASLSGGHYLAVDITAGELEKKTMEPLRQLPISMANLLGGKLLAVFSFCSLSALLSGLGFFLMSRLDFIRTYTEINIQVQAEHLFFAFLLLLPFCLLAAALELLIGSFTKTVKEAQTYISVLIALGSIPTYAMAIMDIKEKSWSLYVPIVSQYFLINRWQRGQVVASLDLVLCSIVTIALALMAILAAAFFYQREPTAS